jgi:pyrroloquinoline quinone (PQQ) biosynthesis protein C
MVNISAALPSTAYGGNKTLYAQELRSIAERHPCWQHPFFAYLESGNVRAAQLASLLKNYDAHAGLLRRLLLQAASIMPEEAAGFVLENIRNEYGNGNSDHRHQLQLLDVAAKIGASQEQLDTIPLAKGVLQYIATIPAYYAPSQSFNVLNSQDMLQAGTLNFAEDNINAAAFSAGAITATEIMAINEFKSMQKTFAQFGLENHIWFNHVTVEVEHSDESIDLAYYFVAKHNKETQVLNGFTKVLDANIHLYEGFLSSMQKHERLQQHT